ncbi:hypothetical protein KQY30_31265 [Streptomyces sp. GMY02]|uniref:hypothetical protein n=1 Tax=Streptomyces sp. GMY02 TaxID=1333528 RepID=UPI001C2C64A5|nr:hypothetical protein [Streptomyces sp. GMY02]QXE38047.1 hypothetical protein KQY30_31265 [Streptomyces sp. GMY02]
MPLSTAAGFDLKTEPLLNLMVSVAPLFETLTGSREGELAASAGTADRPTEAIAASMANDAPVIRFTFLLSGLRGHDISTITRWSSNIKQYFSLSHLDRNNPLADSRLLTGWNLLSVP